MAPGHTEPAGVVVTLCSGHRCAALTRTCGDGGIRAAVARSSGGVLISAPCLRQCAEGAVGAVAIRAGTATTTGPSVWLGGLESTGRLASLADWVEDWRSGTGSEPELSEDLRGSVLGYGPPVRLAPSGGQRIRDRPSSLTSLPPECQGGSMSTESSGTRISNSTADSRYTATVDDEAVGVAEYERSGSTIVFTHTVVDPGSEGHGIGTALVRQALDEAREQQLTVVPRCRFVAAFIGDHPEYQDLVG